MDYFYNMIRLCRKADPDMEAGTQIKHLLEGLSMRDKSYIEVRKPETTERFLQILLDCDKVILEEMKLQQLFNRQSGRQLTYRSTSNVPANNETSAPTTADPPNRVPVQTKNSGCWLCGSMDHYRQHCPKNC